MSQAASQHESIFIGLAWPQFAIRTATEIQQKFVDCGARNPEWTDEFVVRQAVREGFALLCPGLSTQRKEAPYPESLQRLDLYLGENHPLNMAVELKSDPDNLQGVRDDWMKICGASQKYKLVIFAGATSEKRLKIIESTFNEKNITLSNSQKVHEITAQSTSFSDPANPQNRMAAFIWIWSVGAPLPKGVELRVIA